MWTGLMPASSGSAQVYGHDLLRDLAQIRPLLGFCPQHDTFWPTLTVQQHLHLYGGLKGLSADQLASAVSEAVREVDLVDKFQEEVQTLSGGQKRRLSLALAFIVHPFFFQI
jgi:ABC-type multidrug transport system ATPase subunit